jgi:hypothetical protein
MQRKPFVGGYREFVDALLDGTITAERLYESGGALEYDDPEAPDVTAIGGIYLSVSSADPGLPAVSGGLGYGTWARFGRGRVLVGVDEPDADWQTPELEQGAKTTASAGTVSQPSFTGTSSQATSAISAGTPSGTCSAPTFTGSALSAHGHTFTGDAVAGTLVSAGTPDGSCSAPAFTGTSAIVTSATSAGTPAGTVSAHAHLLPITGIGGTTPRSTAGFGTSGATVAGVRSLTNAASTTAVARELSSSVAPTFAGSALATHTHTLTPAGTVAAPTFTGSALGTHQHSTTATGTNATTSAGTPAGSVSAPTFSGAALSGHSHTLTPAGVVSQPAFSGAQQSVVQPSITVYMWRRTA